MKKIQLCVCTCTAQPPDPGSAGVRGDHLPPPAIFPSEEQAVASRRPHHLPRRDTPTPGRWHRLLHQILHQLLLLQVRTRGEFAFLIHVPLKPPSHSRSQIFTKRFANNFFFFFSLSGGNLEHVLRTRKVYANVRRPVATLNEHPLPLKTLTIVLNAA